MDAGAARMALYTTLKVIEEAKDLKFEVAGERVKGCMLPLSGQLSSQEAVH